MAASHWIFYNLVREGQFITSICGLHSSSQGFLLALWYSNYSLLECILSLPLQIFLLVCLIWPDLYATVALEMVRTIHQYYFVQFCVLP